MRQRCLWWAAGVGLATFGCASARSIDHDDTVSDAVAVHGDDKPGAIPEECQGFPLAGLKYSPGGEVLPNVCEPFDATTNNPYAVRCIDAYPEFDSGFPG